MTQRWLRTIRCVGCAEVRARGSRLQWRYYVAMDISIGGFQLTGLASKNVILGRNGSGKSFLLKQLDQLPQNNGGYGKIRYISPERGGLLVYDPNIENNITNDVNWMTGTRRQNQAGQFRQQSASLFRRLELMVLREIEAEAQKAGYKPRSFATTIDGLNVLLDRVRLERDTVKAFKIVDRATGQEVSAQEISSGETELISLGIEIASFVREATADAHNLLLVDEPDVHLHPDLQDRLARFAISILQDQPVTLILATHSTPLLAALAENPETRVAFKRSGISDLTFKPVSDVDRAILPIFGAHPLSNVYNQSPVLLVEGEDDERIWQQAVRSGGGRIRLFPRTVDSIDNLATYEAEVNELIDAVYDNATGYSLRDRDVQPEDINDVGHVVRMRLACRAAENLMLSDGALALAGMDWAKLQAALGEWVQANEKHKYHADVLSFVDGGLDRKGHDLKEIRNILAGLIGNKPWEVLVGQAIAELARAGGEATDGSLRDFLGAKTCEHLLKLTA